MTGTGSINRISRAAFTLIELLVVMAITAILLGLIFGPLIQSFNLTNRARVQALTQDTARRAMEIGFRDLSNGVFVFDNTSQPVNLWVHAQDTTVFPLPVDFGMVDLVPPARVQDQSTTLQPQDIDPTTGLAMNRGALALPVAPGRVIVRYFLGLRDNTSTAAAAVKPSVLPGSPVKPYVNYYSNPRAYSLTDHNPVILYRAVVSPYLPNGQVDERFFLKDPTTGAPVIYDSNFFYDTSVPANGLPAIPGFTSKTASYNAQGYGQRWENWKAIARAMVPTDRADEVVQVLDDNGAPTYFNYVNKYTNATYSAPRLNPLVRFQPTYVGNDAGSPSSTSDRSEGAINVAPSTYVEQYGHWTLPYRMYMYQNLDYDMATGNPVRLFYWENDGNVTDEVRLQTWNIANSTRLTDAAANLMPSQTPRTYGLAVQQPLLLDPTSGIQINPLTESKLFGAVPLTLFTADARRGLINCVFPDSVMLHASKANGYAPTPSQWANDSTAPNVAYPGDTDMPNVAKINERYDRTVQAHGNDPSNVLRYIKLSTPPSNGGNSPLNALAATPVNPGDPPWPVSIVPGSLVVRGPDQRPGANHGREVIYRQVSSDTSPQAVGPNEYRLGRYENGVVSNDPDPVYRNMRNALFDPFVIIFDSQKDVPGENHALPTLLADGVTAAAPITVTYQFQMNSFWDRFDPNDNTRFGFSSYTVKADYLTRQLMTFSLGVRLYEFNSGQPQQVTLTQKIKIRNLQR